MNLGLTLYRGKNASQHFLKSLLKVGDRIKDILKVEKKMIITTEQEQEFNKKDEGIRCGYRTGYRKKARKKA